MINKFSRKELERLNCSEEEVSLVMKYQKFLPMPSEDFEMNARTLHEYLGVGKKITTWIKGRIDKYDFVENKDYKIEYIYQAVPILGTLIFQHFHKLKEVLLV